MQFSQPLLYRVFFIFSVFVFFVFLFYRIVFIYYPHPSAAGVDNNVVYFIQNLLAGKKLYTDPAQPPYSVAQYGPLYYYLTAFLCRISGVTADNVLGIFEVSKSLCLVLNGMLAATIFFTAKNIFNFPVKRCCFLALLTFIFIEGNSFARPDSLEHLFFFLSFYFFLAAIRNQENGKSNTAACIASASIAVLAIFSKQSAITLPLIAMIWLPGKRQNKKGLFIYMGSFAVTLAVALLFMEMCTGVKEMYFNIILGLDNGIRWGPYWRDIIMNFYSWYGCLWVLSFIFIYALLRKENRQLFQYLATALLIQFLVTNLFALKFGATSNYFTNWWTMLFLAMAIYWNRFQAIANAVHTNLTVIILFFFLLLKTGLVVQPAIEKIRWSSQKLAFYKTEKDLAEHVKSLHDSSRNFTVFCNLFSPDSYLNNLLFRHTIVPQYDIVSLASYPKRVYDYTHLRNELQKGTVEFIITKGIKTPLRFMDIELKNYSLVETKGPYTIYRYTSPE